MIAARGTATVPAQCAAVLDQTVDVVYLAGGLISFASIAETEKCSYPFGNFVPHFLEHTDLPDLARSWPPLAPGARRRRRCGRTETGSRRSPPGIRQRTERPGSARSPVEPGEHPRQSSLTLPSPGGARLADAPKPASQRRAFSRNVVTRAPRLCLFLAQRSDAYAGEDDLSTRDDLRAALRKPSLLTQLPDPMCVAKVKSRENP